MFSLLFKLRQLLTEFSDLSEDDDDNDSNSSQEQGEATNDEGKHRDQQQVGDDPTLNNSIRQRQAFNTFISNTSQRSSQRKRDTTIFKS